MLLPLHLIATTLLGLLSIFLLAVGLFCLYGAFRKIRRRYYTPVGHQPRPASAEDRAKDSGRPILLPGALKDSTVMVPLVMGVLLPMFSFGGRHFIQYAFPTAQDEPKAMRNGTVRNVRGTAGANIRVEIYGPSDAPALLFTHGWGMDSTEWYYAKRDLSDRFQLILWDLPGLGESSEPTDRDFALEKLAQNLRFVLATANEKPVILVGHSIGA